MNDTEQERPVRLTRQLRGQVRRATTRLFTRECLRTPSSTNPAIEYTTVLMTDGKLQCTCRGWTIKKKDQPRQCKHTRALAGGRPTQHDDEFLYLVEVMAQRQEELP